MTSAVVFLPRIAESDNKPRLRLLHRSIGRRRHRRRRRRRRSGEFTGGGVGSFGHESGGDATVSGRKTEERRRERR